MGIQDAFRQDEVDQARGSGLYIVAASTELGVALIRAQSAARCSPADPGANRKRRVTSTSSS